MDSLGSDTVVLLLFNAGSQDSIKEIDGQLSVTVEDVQTPPTPPTHPSHSQQWLSKLLHYSGGKLLASVTLKTHTLSLKQTKTHDELMGIQCLASEVHL